jgi:propionyl-CoA carboxylase alpha chain
MNTSTPVNSQTKNTQTIHTLLIANRGEIARRILRTAKLMGIRTVAVYSEPDRLSPHVREADVAVAIGGSSATESYLCVESILGAAKRSGANAIHPGYGFLSENADFAQAVIDAGLIFVGPTPENIRDMGGKIAAKKIAMAAGMPTLPSVVLEGDDPSSWASAVASVGYPVLLKASAGGGGKGMRIVRAQSELDEALLGARREALASFGDGTVFAERYLPAPRHIEIQVFGDTQGNVVHLHERECSIQRRHQKIVEEAPSPAVTPGLRARMGSAAVDLVKSIGYVGAGTVELLLDDASGEFYFLEMNTRLQVEHPVTECITGTDLVRWQLDVAMGKPLPLSQDQIELHGHAIEVRLYAEDPAQDFLPTFGTLSKYGHQNGDGGLRFDEGVETGSVVSTFYDPMLAKVITHAPTRTEAAARMAAALLAMEIHGVTTNCNYLAAIMAEPRYLAGATTTAYVSQHGDLLDVTPSDARVSEALVVATLANVIRNRRSDTTWSFGAAGWRSLRSAPMKVSYRRAGNESALHVSYAPTGRAWMFSIGDEKLVARVIATESPIRLASRKGRSGGTRSAAEMGPGSIEESFGESSERVTVEIDGITSTHTVSFAPVHSGQESSVWVNNPAGQIDLIVLPKFPIASLAAVAGGPTAPVPGRVVAVNVVPGDSVVAGQVLVVMEAMKMEHKITAAANATIAEVRCAVGNQVDARQVLVTFTE